MLLIIISKAGRRLPPSKNQPRIMSVEAARGRKTLTVFNGIEACSVTRFPLHIQQKRRSVMSGVFVCARYRNEPQLHLSTVAVFEFIHELSDADHPQQVLSKRLKSLPGPGMVQRFTSGS
ncbi:hypothetical protein HX882_31245 [Pseudomonas gingeri]|uniref:Uncharacterized protein n=1 Tax=Pseudomonas gingeri TaxID=117681 RepID=A0A7Y7XIL2_9PSED|nr:hypothetical protein [Pseudomonas gingeri]NWC00361.1 hypothetical protein [Pseudomonas gingeri]